MSDELDATDERSQVMNDAAIQIIRNKAKLDPGVEGECDKCGDHTIRLIGGYCAPCRDKYKLP